MIATNAEKISSRQGVLAAMVYLATFLAFGYGICAVAVGAPFLKSIALAYPLAFAATVLLLVCGAVRERRHAALKKMRLTSSACTRSARCRPSD